MHPSADYTDQLRQVMTDAGISVSPVTRRGNHAGLRFDAVDITEKGVTFLWLGKPVFMARRHQDELVHVRGEMALDLH